MTLSFMNWLVAAGEIVPMAKAAQAAKETSQAGRVSLTWVVAVALFLGALAIGLRKSRRTHLD